MKILWLTNVPSPYRVDFFNELGKECELTVLFEKKTSDERDGSWGKYSFSHFRGIILNGLSINADTACCPSVLRYVRQPGFDHIVVTNISSPTGILAIWYLKTHHIPYWIEGDGGFAKNGRGAKERLKRYLISGAKGYFSTGEAHDQYYLAYGADKSRIFRYPFTSLHESDILSEPVSAEKKTALREKLGMSDRKVILTIGQFIHRKGFDLLLQCADAIREADFYFIGGEPTEEYLRIQQEKQLTNVHYVGFCDKEKLKEYYQAADLFVLPTREDIWGLVINEAMANGLPIISTDRCGAALELVKDGENGFVVPVGDTENLTKKIRFLLIRESTVLSSKSISLIQEYTIEQMSKIHLMRLGQTLP